MNMYSRFLVIIFHEHTSSVVKSRCCNIKVGFSIASRIVRGAVVGRFEDQCGFLTTIPRNIARSRHLEAFATSLGKPKTPTKGGGNGGCSIKPGIVGIVVGCVKKGIGVAMTLLIRIAIILITTSAGPSTAIPVSSRRCLAFGRSRGATSAITSAIAAILTPFYTL